MKKDNKLAIGCSTFLLGWAVFGFLVGLFFNSINTASLPFEEVVFYGVLFGFLFAFIVFCIVMAVSSYRNKSVANRPKPPFVNPYVDVAMYESGNRFPTVHYSNVILQPGEQMIYVTPAQTFIQKEQVVGYTGGSAGASVRVAKGLTIRSGSSRGIPIRQNVTKFNDGDYIVTTKRLLFLSQNESFEFRIEKITAFKIIAQDAFMIMQGNKQKNICVDISQAKYAAGLSRWAIEDYLKNNGR